MALLLSWLLALLAVLQICLPCASGRKLSTNEKNAVLRAHNYYRKLEKASNMRMMEWNNDLEKYADEYVRRCTTDQSPTLKRMGLAGEFYAGENILKTKPGRPDYTKMIRNWYNERGHFDYETVWCKKPHCHHYTQMVWAESYKLGCAINNDTRCSEKVIFMCLYAPGGISRGEKPFLKGIPCSECRGVWEYSCTRGLCGKPDLPETGKGPTGRPLSTVEKQAILDVHNYYRKLQNASNMRMMVWNTELEKFADSWVGQCAFGPTPFRKRLGLGGELFAGENLWIGTPRNYNYTQIVGQWYREIKDFDYDNLSCKNICSRYTQVVWAKSYKLGCGISRDLQCKEGLLFTCEYAPGGNLRGNKPFLKGSPCSECKGAWRSSCTEGLCRKTDGSRNPTGFRRTSINGAEKTTANVVFAVILLAATSDL